MKSEDYLRLIAPAMHLVVKKGEDYNNASEISDYFPLGDASYYQMLHLKTLRLKSLLYKGGRPNYDSKLDTVLDLLNYCVFYLDYLDKGPRDV